MFWRFSAENSVSICPLARYRWELPINPLQDERCLIYRLVYKILLGEIRFVRIHNLNHLPGAKQSGSKSNRALTIFGHLGSPLSERMGLQSTSSPTNPKIASPSLAWTG